jgi:hypothetical protein
LKFSIRKFQIPGCGKYEVQVERMANNNVNVANEFATPPRVPYSELPNNTTISLPRPPISRIAPASVGQAAAQYINSGSPFAGLNTSVLQREKAAINLTPTAANISAMPFFSGMTTEEKGFFKPQIDAIVKLSREVQALERAVKGAQVPLAAQSKALNALKLPAGTTNFRGKNAPQVYVAANPSTGDLEVRGNFSESGFPFRVTNPNSFNAVLRNMKTARKSMKNKANTLKGSLALIERKKVELAQKKAELDKLTLRAKKDLVDYQRKRIVQTEKTSSSMPTTRQSVNTDALAAARQSLAAPTAKKSWWPFGKKGGTRRRRNNRKTRKGRKANRR